ncbi:MAG: cbb3-type cytochrome c oxidase subunit II [Mariprofundales bacterium]|nr:cbb3-type cytochrome c oxidase subunit II [Mariprofundales bacterium]
MAFREYKIGCIMFGIALSTSMFVTIFLPGLDISRIGSTEEALKKQLTYGWESAFNYYDPFLLGKDKPIKVVLTKDPETGKPIDKTEAYVFTAGTHFPDGLTHDNIMGTKQLALSKSKGLLAQATEKRGGVFLVDVDVTTGVPYVEFATATKGWQVAATLKAADVRIHAGSGKTMFIREGCWWCHTLLPEETQDWQSFGRPPVTGDFNGESPTSFGSDRKGPDLLHVGSRNSSREWMTMHFFNPRLVQPHSIMPRFNYLWGKADINGKVIDRQKWDRDFMAYARGDTPYPPAVPIPARNSEARYIIDFVLNLK